MTALHVSEELHEEPTGDGIRVRSTDMRNMHNMFQSFSVTFPSVSRFELCKTHAHHALPDHYDHCLRRVQMNFSGIKDFQTRVDIATLSVGMMCFSGRIRGHSEQ